MTGHSEQTTHGVAARPGRPRRVLLFAAVALVALGLDLLSKSLVVSRLGLSHPPIRILGGAVYIDEVQNSGAAFSLGTGFTVVLSVVAIVVVAVIVRAAKRMRSVGWAIALGLILGGALGNLVDRLFRAPGTLRGKVVDWISLFGPDGAHWPIFNLADSAIVCGAALAALLTLFGVTLDGAGDGGPQARSETPPATAGDPARAADTADAGRDAGDLRG